MFILRLLGWLLRALLARRKDLVLENLALRQQLALYQRRRPRPRARPIDRLFWVGLSRLWGGWCSALAAFQPETVLRWHRLGFRLYWHRKSRGRSAGRPPLRADVAGLIRRMARENPTWGAPRIHAELHLLGIDVARSTVSRHLPGGRRPPSQGWKTFLSNHVGCLTSMDFFAVPTATFRSLFVFVVLSHARRRVLHFGVTRHPTAAWVAGQLREAFPFAAAPRYLIRDRDAAYGEEVRRCLRALRVAEVVTAPRSPWQNPFVERLIGSVRRECLDRVIVLGEGHLRRILASYLAYYHDARTHLSLGGNAPNPRGVEVPARGPVTAVPMVGGLHHRYRRWG
jgi:transposase InsO family protein